MRFSRLSRAAFIVALAALGACTGTETAPTAAGSAAPALVRHTALGPVLAGHDGKTLYILATDPDGQSDCYGRCATAWPPAIAAPGARPTGAFTLVTRKDGSQQWAYKGRALYGWVKDKKPGDVTGHNVGDVWFAAKP